MKIKDNIDLKLLEKKGFRLIEVWGKRAYVYDFVPYTAMESSFLVVNLNREISTGWVNFRKSEHEFFNLLFDLIEEGLIERSNYEV